MKPFYRLLTIFLIPTLFLNFWASGVSPAYAAMADEKVTIFTPESVESAPIEAVKQPKSPSPPKKGISKWWYVLILAAVAGGAAAASGGSGSGDDSGGGGSSGTGTSTVTW